MDELASQQPQNCMATRYEKTAGAFLSTIMKRSRKALHRNVYAVWQPAKRNSSGACTQERRKTKFHMQAGREISRTRKAI
jgi:hypothetical protein